MSYRLTASTRDTFSQTPPTRFRVWPHASSPLPKALSLKLGAKLVGCGFLEIDSNSFLGRLWYFRRRGRYFLRWGFDCLWFVGSCVWRKDVNNFVWRLPSPQEHLRRGVHYTLWFVDFCFTRITRAITWTPQPINSSAPEHP